MSKVAIITGGAGGIGQAVADRLTKEKQTVVILDANEEAGNRVVTEFRKRGAQVEFLRSDVAREAEVQAAFARWLKLDQLAQVVLGPAAK